MDFDNAVNKIKEFADDAISSLSWVGLNPHLVAKVYPVKKNGDNWERDEKEGLVVAPITDGSMNFAPGWQSPFEGAGLDNAVPTISAMLQSGAIQAGFSKDSDVGQFIGKFEGRTGMTKLNSTQIFHGMPPIKITMTFLFRALVNAKKEVEDQINKLVRWALPIELAKDGAILSAIKGFDELVKDKQAGQEREDAVQKIFYPSLAPRKVALKYKGKIFSPLLIESIDIPLTSPITMMGNFCEASIPVSFGSLTAWDSNDWENINGSDLF